MTIIEPKIILHNAAIAPDTYDESQGLIPKDDFVVSRNRDGSVASYYGDCSWDLSPYDPEGRTRLLHFPYWRNATLTPTRDHLAREARWLIFLLMWKQDGYPLAYKSLSNYLHAISEMAKFGERRSYTIKEILTSETRLVEFLDSDISGSTIASISYLNSILFRLDSNKSGGFSGVSGEAFKELVQRAEEFRQTWKQHPPIPTRIYSTIISSLIKELEDFESIADNYFALVVECASGPSIGRCETIQQRNAKKLKIDEWQCLPDFKSLLRKYRLESYFSNKELTVNVKGLSTGLAYIQKCIKLLIQTFSGMRDCEARSIPYQCLEIIKSNGKHHCLILGRTTKLNKGRIKRVRWVTNSVGHRAINTAKRIADIIYTSLGEAPQKPSSRINNYPLFVSSAYLPLSGGKTISRDGRYLPAHLDAGSLLHFEKRKLHFMPTIEDCDLHELEQIDPHRAWRAEDKFHVGKHWPLTSHQLRRSLALYAQRSGLVSLPSLRRQLQHITEEMSLFYARGSAFAQNFLGKDKEHFGWEWQSLGPISAALSYTLNVLYSDQVLFGGHIDWVKTRLCGTDGKIAIDREETLRRFKKGELSYKETFLGGCTNTSECKQSPLKWLDVDCLAGCSNLVGSLPKLERIIIAQTRWVDSLNPTSIEFRAEKSDLDILIATHNKVLGQQKQITEVSCNINF